MGTIKTMRRTAKKHKENRDQRARDEKSRLSVKMQADARDERANRRENLSKVKLVSGDTSPRTLRIKQMAEQNKILFACSGIAMERLPMTNPEVTIVVTSKRLVEEFKEIRNRDDKVKVEVRFPGKKNICVDGLLGLYDKYIALVTCFYYSDPCKIHVDEHQMYRDLKPEYLRPNSVEAVGRAFSSGTLMSAKGKICLPTSGSHEGHLMYSNCAITEAGLGGPVVTKDGRFIGLNIECDTKDNSTLILPWELLMERLVYFEKYSPNSTNYREYTLPKDLFSIVPPGHWNTVKYLTSMGYPEPPPLVLEKGGKLCDKFEEDFGDLYGYKGLDCNLWCRGTEELVFSKLRTEVLRKLCRRVVLLTSFNGDMRSFACTGYIIKWHKKGTPVILTSASLIRSLNNEDTIDEKLKIAVFLPPNQHATGTLELYHLDYNIAVISVQKRLHCVHPENIFHGEKGRKKVVALGREVKDGLLMGTIGVVAKLPMDGPSKLNCKDLKLSTCKIKKAGIGGPLVNFIDGSYVGMNFYDGTTKTPYLPRHIIAKVLSATDLPSQIKGMSQPTNITNVSVKKRSPVRGKYKRTNRSGASIVTNRWPVPKPYWYHPRFDVSEPAWWKEPQ
ncbi:uncharacterized protein LOC124676935 isoform X2 [Lolium rigidum]|uniref:uncharacterized protein LOC124676935 isoform X2 n=1 Tax=Lolium rigidum TaxID=89674 RepID=UPI001F5D8581|nr:uncharacterized protein LOC124676935 isoform X2 [Lolium rigidum]